MHFREWKCLISIKISLNFVPNGPVDNMPALVQITAWRRTGHKLRCPRLPTHICVSRPQWVKVKWVERDFRTWFRIVRDLGPFRLFEIMTCSNNQITWFSSSGKYPYFCVDVMNHLHTKQAIFVYMYNIWLRSDTTTLYHMLYIYIYVYIIFFNIVSPFIGKCWIQMLHFSSLSRRSSLWN